MTFLQAAAFQWVNPKGWAMALGAISPYTPSNHYLANLLLVAAIFAVVNLPCVTLWTTLGLVVRRFLDRPQVLRAFNMTMAGLLLVSLYPVVGEIGRALPSAPEVHPAHDLGRGPVRLRKRLVAPAVEGPVERPGDSARLQILMEAARP